MAPWSSGPVAPDILAEVGAPGLALGLPLAVLLSSVALLRAGLGRSRPGPLIGLLAASDAGLSLLQLRALLLGPQASELVRFTEDLQPGLQAHFTLTLGLLLFSLLSVLACLLAEVLLALPRPAAEKKVPASVFLVSPHASSPARPPSPWLHCLALALPPALAAAALACKISTQLDSCLGDTPALGLACTTPPLEGRLANHGALAPALLRLAAGPLHFPLTLLGTLPLLLGLARSQDLFSRDPSARRPARILFLASYSLFLWDLFLFSRPALSPSPALLSAWPLGPGAVSAWRLEVGAGGGRRELAALARAGLALYCWWTNTDWL